MKRIVQLSLALLIAGAVAAPVAGIAQGAAPQVAAEGMTQGQLAQLLVQKLGIHRHLPLNPSDLECVALLMQFGIFPAADAAEGWNPGAVLTTIDFVRTLVRALGLAGRVADPASDQAWVDVLKEVEVPADDVVSGLSKLPTVHDIFASFTAFGLTQDPLYKNPVALSDVEEALDAINLPGIVPPLPEPPEEPDLPKPKPVTPTLLSAQ